MANARTGADVETFVGFGSAKVGAFASVLTSDLETLSSVIVSDDSTECGCEDMIPDHSPTRQSGVRPEHSLE